MTTAASARDEGRLFVGDEDLGHVDYVLRASKHGETKFVAGEITSNPQGIMKASMQNDTRLRLHDGNMVKIHVYQATFARGLFQAKVVPGF